MALVHADSLVVDCLSPQTAKQWWLKVFECREAAVPEDWDDPLPSDVALQLPGSEMPTILLTREAERRQAGLAASDERPIISCTKATKAREFLERKGSAPGPIQEHGGARFFEIRDPEGHSIEICEDP